VSKSKGKRYSDEEREELLALFDQSGYSASRFCSEMGLCYGTLKRWRSRQSPRVDLLEVAGPVGVDGASLRVFLPNGVRCEVAGGLGRSEVAGLIRDLASC